MFMEDDDRVVRMHKPKWLTAVAALGLLAGPAVVTAQRDDADRRGRVDVALGVTMNSPADVNRPPKCTELGLPCLTPRTFPDFGFALQAAVHANAHLAVAAEASLYPNHWDTVGVNHALTNHVSAVLIGPRFTTGPRNLGMGSDTTRFDAFAQILGGPERSTVLATRFALQPGAGIDARLSPERTSVRVTFDYRATRSTPRNLSGGRVLFALAVMMP